MMALRSSGLKYGLLQRFCVAPGLCASANDAGMAIAATKGTWTIMARARISPPKAKFTHVECQLPKRRDTCMLVNRWPNFGGTNFHAKDVANFLLQMDSAISSATKPLAGSTR